MSNALVPVEALGVMAEAFAKSNMFGAKTKEQALALLLLAQADGIHPATAMRDFDVISGRPAKKAEAMLRSFIAAGGKVEWHSMTDELAEATFSHPSGGSARISWDMKRAKNAGLAGKDVWAKYPRQMLANRVISEGCRRIYPASTSGLYEPGEVRDMPVTEKNMGAVEVLPPETAPGSTQQPPSSSAGVHPAAASETGPITDDAAMELVEALQGITNGEARAKAAWKVERINALPKEQLERAWAWIHKAREKK